MKTALVLPGAGAKARPQVGMLKAFREANIKHDFAFGASSGGLCGAMFHAGCLDQLIELWLNMRDEQVFAVAPQKIWSQDGCFFDSSPLRRLIAQNVSGELITKNGIPFYVAVTDRQKSAGVSVLTNELADPDLVDFLLASASLPIAFPPVRKDDRILVDGGCTENYPLVRAAAMGAGRIILLTPAAPEPPPEGGPIHSLEATISILENAQKQAELEAVRMLHPAVEVIEVCPTEPQGVGLLNFTQSSEKTLSLIDQGYALARAIFQEHGLWNPLNT